MVQLLKFSLAWTTPEFVLQKTIGFFLTNCDANLLNDKDIKSRISDHGNDVAHGKEQIDEFQFLLDAIPADHQDDVIHTHWANDAQHAREENDQFTDTTKIAHTSTREREKFSSETTQTTQ